MIGGVYLITILRAYIHYSVVLHTYTIFETAVVNVAPGAVLTSPTGAVV